MVKLGIAGMGYIGRVHLEAASKVANAEVIGVSSSRPDQRLRNEHNSHHRIAGYSPITAKCRSNSALFAEINVHFALPSHTLYLEAARNACVFHAQLVVTA